MTRTTLPRAALHEYQLRAISWVTSRLSAALFLDMGLGKTVTTLTAFSDLKAAGVISTAVIVAPKRVAASTWTEEAERWEHLRELKLVHITGTPRRREKLLEEPADIYILGRDLITWFAEVVLKDPRKHFDLLVLDELSGFKSPRTQRFRAIKALRTRFNRFLGLTGTPAPNGLLDLWAEIYALDGGAHLGKYISHYREDFFLPGRHKGLIVYEWLPRKGARKAIAEKLSDICLSMTAEDYLNLPPVLYKRIVVELTPAERKQYTEFRKTRVLPAPGKAITAANAAVIGNKLQQWTGGAVYNDEGTPIATTPAKLERLKEVVEEAGQPALIAYQYRHELERLREIFPEARTIDDPRILEAWNRGEVRILLAHPASVGHGLNLQKGGNLIIWYSTTWSLELYRQFNARLARQGQQKPVIVAHMVAAGTIDARILDVLRGKKTLEDAILEELKQ